MNFQSLFVSSCPDALDLAALIGRLFFGICFFIHGLGKLGIVGSGTMAGFAGWLKSMGIPAPEFQARMAMATEVIGGLLIATGLFTRVGCAACFGVMIIAGLIGHKGGGYLITNTPPGREYTINLAACCVILFILGPGHYSLDALIFG